MLAKEVFGLERATTVLGMLVGVEHWQQVAAVCNGTLRTRILPSVDGARFVSRDRPVPDPLPALHGFSSGERVEDARLPESKGLKFDDNTAAPIAAAQGAVESAGDDALAKVIGE